MFETMSEKIVSQMCGLRAATLSVVSEALMLGAMHETVKRMKDQSTVIWDCKCGARYEWTKSSGLSVHSPHNKTQALVATSDTTQDRVQDTGLCVNQDMDVGATASTSAEITSGPAGPQQRDSEQATPILNGQIQVRTCSRSTL